MGASLLGLPWIAVLLAVPATWISTLRWLGLGLLVIGYGAALSSGLLGALAAIPVALLLFAAYTISQDYKWTLRFAGHAVFIALAVALSMHWAPGFHNPRVIGPERLTPDAVPFTMYLNLDKPLIGFWLLAVVPWVRPQHELRASLVAGVVGMLATIVACLAAGSLLGIVAWAPKLPDGSGLWLLNNLLLVSVTEEALFRGYLQQGVARLLKRWPKAQLFALCVASVLFGLAHLAGGWEWVVLGTIAGVGYGLAYRHGGLQASVFAHFGLNAAHFFLFTYPMLQQIGKP